MSAAQTKKRKLAGDTLNGRVHYGVCAMRGRPSAMEDRFAVANPLCVLQCGAEPVEVTMFAIFDGHGGKEVAAFCEHHNKLE